MQLDTGKTIQGKAGTNSAITYTITGDLKTSGVDSYQVVVQGQLSTSAATPLYTVPASAQLLISTIKLTNTTASPVTGVTLYVGGSAATNQTDAFTIPANGNATSKAGGPFIVTDINGATQTTTAVILSTDATGTLANGVLPVTLNTVNSNTGSFGTASNVGQFSVNGKGLTTAAANVPIVIAESAVTNLTTDLAAKAPTARLINTTAPITGGGDLSADHTLAISAATTSAAGSQSAVDKAKQDNWAKIKVNILDFGGVGDGSTNNDTALANAMAALPSGGVVMFPAGQFNHNTVFTASGNNILWQGAGPNATTLHFTQTTGDQFTISGYGSGISDMTVQGPGSGTTSTKASGYGVNLTGTESFAYNMEFTYQSSCIGINGPLSEIDHVLCRYYGVSGAVVNQNSDHRINRLFTDNALATLPTGAGIDVQVTASLLISNCNIIHANWCLNVSPGVGVTIPSVKGLNCFFDSSVIGLRAAGAGSFFRSEFTNCWFSSMSTAGVLFAPTTAGANVDGITFINCDIYNNVAGTTNGFSVTTANVGKWKMIGCSVAGWTNGINIIAGAAHYPTIEGNTIGSVSAFGVNTTGIVVGAGAYGGLVIVNNDVNDNTTALTLGAVTITGATYSKYVISSNPGINPRSTSLAPAAPASTVVVTNTTGFRVFVRVKWGATTAPTVVAVNGVSVAVPAAAAADSYILDPGGTFNYTGTVAMASWVWSGM